MQSQRVRTNDWDSVPFVVQVGMVCVTVGMALARVNL